MASKSDRRSIHVLLTPGGITFFIWQQGNSSVTEKVRACPKNLLKMSLENLKTVIYSRISTML
jgi:hypothetical protein